MARGLAAGLAEGLGNGMQLYMQNQYYNGRIDNQEEANRIREEALNARTAKADGSAKGGKGEDYEGLDASLMPIFKPNRNTPTTQPQPVMANPAGLSGTSPTTLPNAGLLTNNPAAAYQAGGLAAPAQAPTQAAPADSEEPFNPRQEIVKQMYFGNLANEPDKLNAIAAAAALNGLGDKVTPWLESIYKFKKSGVFDGAMNLINNNVDGAIDSLKQGGIKLADRPTKVAPDDPNDHRWNINIEGTGQRVMDVRNMVASTMDADKFMDLQNKTKVANAQADSHTANAEESRAKAKSYASGGLGRGGRGGGGASAPKVHKVASTNQGIVLYMTDGTQVMSKGPDGKPLYGPEGMKIAANLVGKTIDPLGDNGNLAGKVTDVATQLNEGGKPPPKARIADLPKDAKIIGTSKGKPIYEVDGKRWESE